MKNILQSQIILNFLYTQRRETSTCRRKFSPARLWFTCCLELPFSLSLGADGFYLQRRHLHLDSLCWLALCWFASKVLPQRGGESWISLRHVGCAAERRQFSALGIIPLSFSNSYLEKSSHQKCLPSASSHCSCTNPFLLFKAGPFCLPLLLVTILL